MGLFNKGSLWKSCYSGVTDFNLAVVIDLGDQRRSRKYRCSGDLFQD